MTKKLDYEKVNKIKRTRTNGTNIFSSFDEPSDYTFSRHIISKAVANHKLKLQKNQGEERSRLRRQLENVQNQIASRNEFIFKNSETLNLIDELSKSDLPKSEIKRLAARRSNLQSCIKRQKKELVKLQAQKSKLEKQLGSSRL